MAAEYEDRAASYDRTRSASQSTLTALLDALGEPNGRSLLDIGGGTGNYATPLRAAGFRVVVADLSPAMLRRAQAKLGRGAIVLGDALGLPFGDGSFDCAISVNVSHHVPDLRRHLGEARRVVGGGRFAVQINTRENLEAHWIFEYFPQAKEPTLAFHPNAEHVERVMRSVGFQRVRRLSYVFEDQADATFEALKHRPERYLEDGYRRNTTFFTRLSADVESAGVERLREDHASGALRAVMARYEPQVRAAGDSTVFAGLGGDGDR